MKPNVDLVEISIFLVHHCQTYPNYQPPTKISYNMLLYYHSLCSLSIRSNIQFWNFPFLEYFIFSKCVPFSFALLIILKVWWCHDIVKNVHFHQTYVVSRPTCTNNLEWSLNNRPLGFVTTQKFETVHTDMNPTWDCFKREETHPDFPGHLKSFMVNWNSHHI